MLAEPSGLPRSHQENVCFNFSTEWAALTPSELYVGNVFSKGHPQEDFQIKRYESRSKDKLWSIFVKSSLLSPPFICLFCVPHGWDSNGRVPWASFHFFLCLEMGWSNVHSLPTAPPPTHTLNAPSFKSKPRIWHLKFDMQLWRR